MFQSILRFQMSQVYLKIFQVCLGVIVPSVEVQYDEVMYFFENDCDSVLFYQWTSLYRLLILGLRTCELEVFNGVEMVNSDTISLFWDQICSFHTQYSLSISFLCLKVRSIKVSQRNLHVLWYSVRGHLRSFGMLVCGISHALIRLINVSQ